MKFESFFSRFSDLKTININLVNLELNSDEENIIHFIDTRYKEFGIICKINDSYFESRIDYFYNGDKFNINRFRFFELKNSIFYSKSLMEKDNNDENFKKLLELTEEFIEKFKSDNKFRYKFLLNMPVSEMILNYIENKKIKGD